MNGHEDHQRQNTYPHPEGETLDRRAFIHRGAAALAGISAGGLLLPLTGYDNSVADQSTGDLLAPAGSTASGGGPVREVHLVAAPGEVEVAPGRTYRTWLYNGQFPGPEIRAKEGERLRITVENQLPEETTIHWHGIPLENAMDGVPGLTQEPIAPGDTFVYEYEATPAGTYIFHSHVNLQLDRGLLGALVIEERTPHVAYDREYTLMLDDFLPGEPQPLSELAGRGCMMGGGMMGGIVPPYEGLLINGRLPEDPAVFEAKRGERLRIRFVNPGGANTYRVAIAGHRMSVTHTDGRPVEPVEVDSFYIGMGERYDVIVEANNPGAWTVMAAPVEGDAPPAQAVLRYTDAARSAPVEGAPEGLQGGRLLEYRDLQSVETLPAGGSGPDRTFDLTLSGGMMMNPDVWTIDGQAYPDADLLEIREGERVRVNIMNMSMMLHPMHLHGHFFRAGNAVKDTIIAEPHMGRVSFDFLADNPGRWFFHCHNLYHLHSGMAREFRYV